jgi:hypothetical protein
MNRLAMQLLHCFDKVTIVEVFSLFFCFGPSVGGDIHEQVLCSLVYSYNQRAKLVESAFFCHKASGKQ